MGSATTVTDSNNNRCYRKGEDLEDGGIDHATDGGQLDDVVDQLEDLKEQIIDGTIEVPTEPS